MFGLWKKKRPLVAEHWIVVLPGFKGATSEFYDEVEAELDARLVPAMDKSRVMFSEGGLATHRRQYLRLRRERFVFDVCSAPFGTAWFFSCRKALLPWKWRLFELVIALGLLAALYMLYPMHFGLMWGNIIFGASVLGGLLVLNALAVSGTADLDAILLKIPVLGSLYEIFLRLNETYFSVDSRLLYFEIVGSVVGQKVLEFAAAQGVDPDDVIFQNISDPQRPQSRLDQIKSHLGDFLKPASHSEGEY